MADTKLEIAVGAAVLATAMGFAVYSANIAGLSVSQDGYELIASFRSADGVEIGTEVRLAGVKIGSVTELELNLKTFRADTTMLLRDEIQIPDDSAISVASEGLLGGNYIEILPGGSPFNIEPGGEIEDTQGSISLIPLLMKIFAGDGE